MSYDSYNRPATASSGAAVDAGLQAHMRGVYNTMGLGLAITGVVAFLVSAVAPLRDLVLGPAFILFAFAPLAMLMFGLFSPARMAHKTAAQLQTLFFIFAAVMGLSMASIFVMFTAESIARVFFITAGTFGATSLYGYTTKRDLSAMGAFMTMGLIGVVIASVVNFFLLSSMVQFIVSILGVAIFTGLAAFETQKIKESYNAMHGRDANNKMAVWGALGRYLSFINLFQSLMHLMGSRE